MVITAVVTGVCCFTSGVLLTLECVFSYRQRMDKVKDAESQTAPSLNCSNHPNDDDGKKKHPSTDNDDTISS